ncbi:hypothetical protein [Latilactobacillus curvatus]|uniref:hypothetical protein n=1 Tax=Latilactobacillus curvatus TaxID=28038 RepID=UPI003CF15CCA
MSAHVGAIKPAYEKVAVNGPFIFWSAPVKTFGRTRWSTVAKGDLYQWLTIRNDNTARKLVALAQALREA